MANAVRTFQRTSAKKPNTSRIHIPEYRRRKPEDGGYEAKKPVRGHGEVTIDNSWIVPYNPAMLLKYQSHINIEIVTDIGVVQYLFKYIAKGVDMTAYQLEDADKRSAPAERKHDGPTAAGQRNSSSSASSDAKQNASQPREPYDEIQRYQQARYIGPVEGFYKIMWNDLHDAQPAVERLAVHCKDMQYVTFCADEKANNAEAALRANQVTTLTAWFDLNASETDNVRNNVLTEKQRSLGPRARDLLYPDIPMCYTWGYQPGVPRTTATRMWLRRKNLQKWLTIG